MRVLQVHNFYQQAGGEDHVVAAERELLAGRGHTVSQYTVHNDAVSAMAALGLASKTIWNREIHAGIRRAIADERIELVHVHNTLPLVSPAVYYAAAAESVPVVQTLHNYRLLCPAATLYRQGEICELCLKKAIPWPAVKHRCYRGSLPASVAVSTMLAAHRLAGTYKQKIDTYIALSEFARAKFCDGGLPAERVTVKPNFVADDPGMGGGAGGYAIFAGRLTEEKGVAVLLEAWKACPQALSLKIAGDGPLKELVREQAAGLPNVEYLGAVDHDQVTQLLQAATFLAFPSRWYEGMPMVVLEAMACGTPVVAFGIGALNELILDGVNGIKLPFGEPSALAGFLNTAERLTERLADFRSRTRAHFEQNFTARANYGLLMGIYERALNEPRSVS